MPVLLKYPWTAFIKCKQLQHSVEDESFAKSHYSDTYRVQMTFKHEPAALKIIRLDECKDLDFHWNVKSEIAALKRLQKHKNSYIMGLSTAVNEERFNVVGRRSEGDLYRATSESWWYIAVILFC